MAKSLRALEEVLSGESASSGVLGIDGVEPARSGKMCNPGGLEVVGVGPACPEGVLSGESARSRVISDVNPGCFGGRSYAPSGLGALRTR